MYTIYLLSLSFSPSLPPLFPSPSPSPSLSLSLFLNGMCCMHR